MAHTQKQIPEDRLIELKSRLDLLPSRSSEASRLVMEFADLYGISKNTVYRRLRERRKHRWASGDI
jgi:transcriptional regulator of acetoin/glycerol metabolism